MKYSKKRKLYKGPAFPRDGQYLMLVKYMESEPEKESFQYELSSIEKTQTRGSFFKGLAEKGMRNAINTKTKKRNNAVLAEEAGQENLC